VGPALRDPRLTRPDWAEDALDEDNEPVTVGGNVVGLSIQPTYDGRLVRAVPDVDLQFLEDLRPILGVC
jgi:hypothetical protein